MSKSIFYEELDKVTEPPFGQKARWIKEYFEMSVFGHEEDQSVAIFRLVRSLRDKIVHRDVISLSFDSKEKFINDIRLEWPTLKGITYHSLAETIGNEIHALFYRVLCQIYELKWDDYQKIA